MVELEQPQSDEENNYSDEMTEFQDFDKEVPENLLDVDIYILDLNDIGVDTVEYGDWRLFVSGGSGEIYTWHLLSSGEKVTS